MININKGQQSLRRSPTCSSPSGDTHINATRWFRQVFFKKCHAEQNDKNPDISSCIQRIGNPGHFPGSMSVPYLLAMDTN
jgi:hypothetical protein